MTGQAQYGPRPWLLVSDIDDTLTGSPDAMERLGAALGRERKRIWFAVNSSRPAASVARTLREDFPRTLRPEAVITALGTEIALDGAPVAAWAARFADWPRGQIFDCLAALGHRPHDPEFQSAAKVSFAVPAAAQAKATQALADAGLPCRIIASGRDDFDVVPETAGKDAAALFLARTLGVPQSRLIVAGDSGNDLAMFRIAGHAIAVANARRELLAEMPVDTSYHATRPHAAGVLEGLLRIGALTAA